MNTTTNQRTAEVLADIHDRALAHALRLRSAAIAHAGSGLYRLAMRAWHAAQHAMQPTSTPARNTSGV